MKKLAILLAMLPFAALADLVMPERSHIEATTYVHRLHRIGYELLKDECDSLGAVDCVPVSDYSVVLWAADCVPTVLDSNVLACVCLAMVLFGLILVFRKHIVRHVSGLKAKLLLEFAKLGIIVSFVIASVLCGLIGHEAKIMEMLGLSYRPCECQVAGIKYVDAPGWVYADAVPVGWLGSCVSAVERIRKPLKRYMHIAPDCRNNTSTSKVVEALKSAPALLKESKGIAIEVLVAAVRAADKDTDYLKNIGKEVSQQRIIDRKGGNPNVGRCSRCGYEGYLPTHPCGEDHHRAKY